MDMKTAQFGFCEWKLILRFIFVHLEAAKLVTFYLIELLTPFGEAKQVWKL